MDPLRNSFLLSRLSLSLSSISKFRAVPAVSVALLSADDVTALMMLSCSCGLRGSSRNALGVMHPDRTRAVSTTDSGTTTEPARSIARAEKAEWPPISTVSSVPLNQSYASDASERRSRCFAQKGRYPMRFAGAHRLETAVTARNTTSRSSSSSSSVSSSKGRAVTKSQRASSDVIFLRRPRREPAFSVFSFSVVAGRIGHLTAAFLPIPSVVNDARVLFSARSTKA
mmetsp:Transcript_58765/g.80165  ORF Transcript_58765/g.80165 Transcript_58765/m.80165 type:complete len:227 (+) Transcript_58765:383-1063(+)